MTDLKPGDLVVLKSGGPLMTVDTINTDIFDDNKVTGVLCAWFVGNKLERARFDPGAIVPAPPQEVSSEKALPQEAEASGEYKAVMNEMVAAMNDAADTSGEMSPAPARRSKRASVRKDAVQSTEPMPSGMN